MLTRKKWVKFWNTWTKVSTKIKLNKTTEADQKKWSAHGGFPEYIFLFSLRALKMAELIIMHMWTCWEPHPVTQVPQTL